MNILKKIYDNKYILLGLIILLQVIVILFWGIRKENFHWDEYYSMESAHYIGDSTPKDCYIWESENYAEKEWIPVSSLKEAFVVEKKDSIIHSDIKYIAKVFLLKDPYACLLNLVESIVCAGKFTKWGGITLNIICLIIGQIFLYRLVDEMTTNYKIASFIICFFGLCGITLTFAVYVRFYCFMIMMLNIVLYLHFRIWKSRNIVKNLVREILALFCIYMAYKGQLLILLYGIGLIGSFIVGLIFTKKYRQLIGYTMPMVGGLIVFLIKYNKYLKLLFNIRGYAETSTGNTQMMLNNAININIRSIMSRGYQYINFVGSSIFGSFIFFILFILALVVLFCYMWKKKDIKEFFIMTDSCKFIWILVGSTIIYSGCMIVFGLWAPRYYSPMFTSIVIIMTLAFLRLTSLMGEPGGIKIQKVLVSGCVIAILYTNIFTRIDFIYPGDSVIHDKLMETEIDDYLVFNNSDGQVMMEAVLWGDESAHIYVQTSDEELNYSDMPKEFLLFIHKNQELTDEHIQSFGENGIEIVSEMGRSDQSKIYVCERK